MKTRELLVKVIVDIETHGWGNYEDVIDELLLEDTGIYDGLKNGVRIHLAESPKKLTEQFIMNQFRRFKTGKYAILDMVKSFNEKIGAI